MSTVAIAPFPSPDAPSIEAHGTVQQAVVADPARDLNHHQEELKVRGFTVLKQLLPREVAVAIGADLRARMSCDPAFATTGYYNHKGVLDVLGTREEVGTYLPLLENPSVLELARRAVGEGFQMSNVGGMILKPGMRTGFGWHVDVPLDWFINNGRPFPGFCIAITALWMLSDFSPRSGATRFVPHSHRSGRPPFGVTADPDGYGHCPDECSIEAPAGSCVVFDNAIWHSAGANAGEADRLHITIPYYPLFLDGGNVGWPSIPRRVFDMLPKHVQGQHRHVREDRTP